MIARKFKWTFGLLAALQAVVSAQPSFTPSQISGFQVGSILHTLIRDQATWLLYATGTSPNQAWLLRTVNAGANYSAVTTLPQGFSPLKFLAKGDTIIGVGNKIVKSFDFGATWSVVPPPANGEDYDNIVRMPGDHLWISAAASGVNKLYQTDFSFAGYTLKYTHNTGFPAVLHNTLKFLSSFSNDTVYFNFNDTLGHTFMRMTTDNGHSWSTSASLLPSHNLLTATHISYIKYHNAQQANLFVFYSGFPTDYVTNDAFGSLQKDTLDPGSHAIHEVTNWMSCGSRNYLVYDYHEDSAPGIQEIALAADKRITYGTFYNYHALNLTQRGDLAIAGYVSQVLLISNLCDNTITDIAELKKESAIHVFPNPVSTHLSIRTAGAYSYSLYNHLGSLLHSGAGEPESRLELSEFPAGIYCLHVETGEGIKRFKLVKQ